MLTVILNQQLYAGRWATGPNDLILPIEEMGFNLLEGIADSGFDRSEHRWAVHPTTCFGLWRLIENAGNNAVKKTNIEYFLNSVLNLAVKPEEGNGRGLIL